jgi:RNA-binding protein YlmH
MLTIYWLLRQKTGDLLLISDLNAIQIIITKFVNEFMTKELFGIMRYSIN